MIHRKKATWKWRQRLELCCHEPKDTWGCQSLEEARKDLPQSLQREHGPLTPWFWTSGLRNKERVNLCYFKLPSLWPFAMAAAETNTDAN